MWGLGVGGAMGASPRPSLCWKPAPRCFPGRQRGAEARFRAGRAWSLEKWSRVRLSQRQEPLPAVSLSAPFWRAHGVGVLQLPRDPADRPGGDLWQVTRMPEPHPPRENYSDRAGRSGERLGPSLLEVMDASLTASLSHLAPWDGGHSPTSWGLATGRLKGPGSQRPDPNQTGTEPQPADKACANTVSRNPERWAP